jgi:hypothetical protein
MASMDHRWNNDGRPQRFGLIVLKSNSAPRRKETGTRLVLMSRVACADSRNAEREA